MLRDLIKIITGAHDRIDFEQCCFDYARGITSTDCCFNEFKRKGLIVQWNPLELFQK